MKEIKSCSDRVGEACIGWGGHGPFEGLALKLGLEK